MNGSDYFPQRYPLDAFLMLVRTTAWELQQKVQAPDALIGMGLIAGMATACQGLFDVKLPTGQCRPTSLNLIAIAESGERKSTVDALVFAPLYEHDCRKAKAFQAALDSYQAKRELWEARGQGLRNRLAKAVSKGEATEAIQAEMAQHTTLKPTKPRLRRFMRQNITPRAIMDTLRGDGESIAITTDEGQVMFKGETMAQLGLLNKAWDGAPMLTLDRADFDNVLVMNPRVTISIMTQKQVLQAYLMKHGDIAKGSGHWARYLFGWPESMKGFRSVNTDEHVWECLPLFQARMQELLEKYEAISESGEVKREVVEFSDDAKARWFELSQQTEWMLRPGDYLNDIHDFASKIMELLGRLAAVFHCYSGEEGKVTLDTLERAFTVVQWHLEEYKRMFSPQFALSQGQVDAQAVFKYLRDSVWQGPRSDTYVPKNHVRQYGPVRDRDRLNAALRILEAQRALWVVVAPRGKQRFVRLSDWYFGGGL
ncbi:YfjI family protein [Fulvimonas yonginensis]|uniref:YfjI family protein n=1 Tax=Fulvimonas yonginensis TaxID=1495200 RepID=A0ABU8J8X8_9GAMM